MVYQVLNYKPRHALKTDSHSFKKVSEWQSQCYRLVNGVKIDGVACTSSDQCEIRKVLLKELDFLSSVIVPEREE